MGVVGLGPMNMSLASVLARLRGCRREDLRVRTTWRVLVLLATVGLCTACGSEAAPPPAKPAPLEIGARLPQPVSARLLADPASRVTIDLGARATVFYAWSVPCPCIESAEHRLHKLVKRYAAKGVVWYAVAGEPRDTLVAIREKKLRLGSPYTIVLDPEQRLCAQLRFDSACQVAVLDAEGTFVYGGALDADYIEGKGEYLTEALDAVLAGRDVPVPYRERTYGCVFDDPASCVQADE